MKILVTGAKGFIGKNLIVELKNRKYTNIFEQDTDTTIENFDFYTKECDFVFHLAGVNRPKEQSEFFAGNFGFTSTLLENLKKYNNKSPILFASSIQAILENPYGISKKAAEDLMLNYSKETGCKVLIYRFPNVFGKWCRPNYNSVIATFSHNIANNIPIIVNDSNAELNLIYIDDLVNEIINALIGKENKKDEIAYVEPVYKIKLDEIVKLLYSFKESRINLSIPNMTDSFVKKLYSNFLSYLPKDNFIYNLKMNSDYRGSFTEFLKISESGQISINVSKPGIVKGNHWHHTKVEKFLVVSGKGVIRFRNINEIEIIEYYVNGDKLQVIDVPPGYTHNIENLGNIDMVTIIWANEEYNSESPDTIFMEV